MTRLTDAAASVSGRPILLVFTLGPEAEARRHPLLPAGLNAEETRLRRACLESVLSAGREAGCRVEVSSPAGPDLTIADAWSAQPGATFGERFASAIRSAFARGGPVIAVGADIPGLAARHIAQAADLARAGSVVVGPSPDGGFYLLASDGPLDDVLGAVRWFGGETRRSLLAALHAVGRSVVLLEPLADLDTPADLERWVAAGSVPGFELAQRRAALRRLLSLRRRPPRIERETLPRSPLVAPRRGRAPPPALSL
jgi:glycosyltransferase A (GT-A) superfamily protein (DUF2064 family)